MLRNAQLFIINRIRVIEVTIRAEFSNKNLNSDDGL
jgi:hypothetical protein